MIFRVVESATNREDCVSIRILNFGAIKNDWFDARDNTDTTRTKSETHSNWVSERDRKKDTQRAIEKCDTHAKN